MFDPHEERARRDEENLRVLLHQVREGGHQYRVKAAEALGRAQNPAATDVLVEVLSDADHELRYVIIRSLGKIKDPEAVPHLLPLLSDEDRWIRQGAIWSLGTIGDPTLSPQLLPVQTMPISRSGSVWPRRSAGFKPHILWRHSAG